jgi:hypothetical protein
MSISELEDESELSASTSTFSMSTSGIALVFFFSTFFSGSAAFDLR